MFFFFSGGMYFLTGSYRNLPLGYGSGDPPEPYIFLRSLNDQFIIEGLLAGVFVFGALFGFFLIYYASKNFYKPTGSYVYLALGIILVIVFFFLLEMAMNSKGINLYSSEF